MTAKQLIKELQDFPEHLPVCDCHGDELSIVCYNTDSKWGIDDEDTYDDEPYILLI